MPRRRYVCLVAALLLGPAGGAAAQVPEAAGVLVAAAPRGEVRLDAAALARLAEAEEEVAYDSGRGPFRARMLGVSLWSVLQAAGALDGLDGRRRVGSVVKVAGRDGHVAALALVEIDPDFVGKPVLLAWRADGRPLPGGELRLALPGDRRGGRNVRDVVRVALE